jgi:hypothetical protein
VSEWFRRSDRKISVVESDQEAAATAKFEHYSIWLAAAPRGVLRVFRKKTMTEDAAPYLLD